MKGGLVAVAALAAAAGAAAQSFRNPAQTLPGFVKAGEFNYGPQWEAYRDIVTGVNGPHARPNTPVNVDNDGTVGYIASGEWLAYTVNVPAGSYDIKYTIAGQPPGSVPLKMFATLEKTCDGAKSAYYVDNFFSTGNYAWFKDVVAGRMTFPGGLATVRICFETVSYFNFKGFSVTAAGSQPFNGQRQAVPGTIAAQKFDAGGQGVAYNENRWTGTPRVRPSEGVNGQWNCISYIDQGEWVKYSVQVANTGSYNVEYLLAGNPPAPVTSSMYLVIDGECNKGPQVAKFSTATFSTWSWEPAKPFGTTSVFMTAGAHTLSVCFEAASWVNFYGLNLIAAGANTGTPYNGVRQLVPGLIKAPLFDAGAEGTAYHDVSTSGTLLRAGAKVGGEATNVGYIISGEWIRYSVDVKAAGMYGVNYELAGMPPNAVTLKMHLSLDSNDCSKPGLAYLNALFATGTWSTGKSYGGRDIWLPAGAHALTVCFDEASYVNFFGLQIGAAGSGNTVPAPQLKANIVATNPWASTNNGGFTTTPAYYKNFPLAWSDEFNGGQLDTGKWIVATGNANGWGNNEKQCYTANNLWVNGGNLVIEARKEWAFDGSQYTSAKVYSRGLSGFNQKYGRIESRAMFDNGQGLWPAIWLLPNANNAGSIYGAWPQSGEIDIFEGTNDLGVAHQTIHYGTQANHQFKGCNFWANGGFSSSSGYHVYSVEWAPWGDMKFYVDGNLACSANMWWSGGGAFPTPFNQPFYAILNLAVGGNWPGWIDNNQFANGATKRAYYDYIRAYDWPTGRRLADGSTEPHGVADDWTVPEGWDLSTGDWKEGFVPTAESFTVGDSAQDRELAVAAVIKKACNAMPYLKDATGAAVPWALPGSSKLDLLIGAEYFDTGGEGCGYHDAEKTNKGNNAMRGLEGVDLYSYDNARNGAYVGSVVAGEWLTYTVFGQTDSTYWVEVYATAPSAGSFKVLIDSTNCKDPTADGGHVLVETRAVDKSAATAWRFYGSVVAIPAGVHSLTLCAVSGNINVDYLKVRAATAAPLGDQTFSVKYTGLVPQDTCYSHCGKSIGMGYDANFTAQQLAIPEGAAGAVVAKVTAAPANAKKQP